MKSLTFNLSASNIKAKHQQRRFAMKLTTLFLISCCSLFSLAMASPITGSYHCTAQDPVSNHIYISDMQVTQNAKHPNIYDIDWTFTDGYSSSASGYIQSAKQQQILIATFKAYRQAPHVKHVEHIGVISYVIQPNKLINGHWFYADSTTVGKTTCVKALAHHLLLKHMKPTHK